jgi:ABC-type phosphate/phosphonate transport system substrate-binding protein
MQGMYRSSVTASARCHPESAPTLPSRHNRVMRRPLALAALALVATTGLAACKSSENAASDLPRPSKEFCKAAAKYDQQIQLRKTKIPQHIKMVSAIAASAPKDIARDADLFLEALEKRRAGDTSVVDNPRIETAVENVLRRAGQDCGWYTRKGM